MCANTNQRGVFALTQQVGESEDVLSVEIKSHIFLNVSLTQCILLAYKEIVSHDVAPCCVLQVTVRRGN